MTETKEDSNKEWKGFRPTAYRLDIGKVAGLGLTSVERSSADNKDVETPITMKEAIQSCFSATIKEIGESIGVGTSELLVTEVTTETGELVFGGPEFNQDVLKALLDLRKDRVNGFEASWFWYDHYWGVTDATEYSCNIFFVVHKDKIVHEFVSFAGHRESGFDPSVFTAADSWRSTWSAAAWVRFWYRKFYQETQTGQVMVLRGDEPELYHFPQGRWRQDVALGLLFHQMTRINAVLWVVVVLIALLGGILLWKL
jgi:hypothetical protein